MPSLLPCLSSALLAGLLLIVPRAEARFGKSSEPASSSGSSRNENKKDEDANTHAATPVGHASSPVHTSSPVTSSPVHTSSPVTSSPVHTSSPVTSSPHPTEHESRPPGPPAREEFRSEESSGYVSEPSLPPPVYVEAEPYTPAPQEAGDYVSRRHKNFLFGFDMQLFQEGTGLGVHVGFEGERLGAMARASGLSLNADDGSGGKDELSLVDLHLSWAVLKGPSGRLRLEGGVGLVEAAHATFMGPSIGVSAEHYLSDSFALEGRVQGVPAPYHQLETSGGLVVYFAGNLIALRGGMRWLLLNDAGLVDGVVHEDSLLGPYVSLGLAI